MLGRENQMLRQRIRELGKSCHTKPPSPNLQIPHCTLKSPVEDPAPKVEIIIGHLF
jgi:hypothetical protein